MTTRAAQIERETNETRIRVKLNLDGTGKVQIETKIPLFDHMLSLFTVHGFFDLSISAAGDLEVDFHHMVEDVGIVLGDALTQALADRKGINRYGHAVTPMDDALTAATIDLSNRPYLAYHTPDPLVAKGELSTDLAKEFFRALANRGGITLHINVFYGENDHHVLESIFKATGRALHQAVSLNKRITGVHSSKGLL